ncbi:transmembrane protein 59 [Acipenser oxyrinchus oxyrinchus]|uniref:Transmembrane protein 59 n=1 Tax=Acipenser oxyrinchus oxyrinchus TaxID=40147 RepID=A0AAD8G1D5_ACIOX|nr:transmembrane protein 59 [Acipenser oxyrinchus oxyrinchus]
MEVWKLSGFCLTFSCLFICSSCSPDIFDGVLGETASCHNTCQMTYSLHTYPREEELYACQRGCRLFSICQFVNDGEDLNQTKAECDSACREAYSQSQDQYACNLGCQSQMPFAEQRQEQLLDMMPRIHLLFPLAFVGGFWNDMMSSAQSFITSSWTFYLQADDGKVVIFQSEPQIQFMPQFEPQKEELKDTSFARESYQNPDDAIYKHNHKNFMQEQEIGVDPDNNVAKEDHNLFRCLSRNAWLPGWILTTTLVLSVLVLIWICCATVATAVDQYVPSEKLSIYGDLEYVKDQKLTPYPPSSLVIISSVAEEEAGPLPSKVNLNQSNI